jgi:hypothetical protein
MGPTPSWPWRERLGATHILDWFHVAMRFERLHQILRGLHWSHPVEAAAWQDLATRAKWRLWHGQHFRVLEALEDIEDDLGPTERPFWQHAEDSPLTLLLHALWALQAFVAANHASLVSYGERYRRGERISTAVVESMVNRVIERRMAKKQQMRWSRRGAHLLIQVRLAVLAGGLQDVFRRWYPRFPMPVPRETTPA